MAIRNSFIRRPVQLIAFRDATAGTPMATTTAAALSPGATTLEVASATNAKVGPIRIGEGEDIERADVTSIAGAVLTLARPLRRAHAQGTVVVEQVAEDIGDVDGDITLQLSKENTDQFSAMRFLQFTQLAGNASGSLSCRVLGTTVENLALACGIPRSTIVGAGTSIAAPKVMTTDLSTVDTVNELSLAVISRRQNGSLVAQEFWGVAMDYTQVTVQLARAQNGAVPLRAMLIGAAVMYETGALMAVSSAARATKGKTFRNLTSIGLIAEAPVAATDVATAAAAGATTLAVTSAANIQPDSWIAVGVDDRVELHWVASKAANALTLRTPLLRAQAVGTRVIAVTRTPFAGISQGGATFTVGGSTTPIIVEDREFPIGMQPQNAQASMTFAIHDLAIEAIVRSLGLPSSAVSAGGALLSEQMLSAPILGVYAQGVTQDGTVCLLTLWGCTQDLANWSLAMGGQNPTSVPYSVRPTSGLQLLQYAA